MSLRSILKRMQDSPHLIEEEFTELFQGPNPSILNHLFKLAITEDDNRIANFLATSSKIEWLFTRTIENKDEKTIDWLLSRGVGIGPWRPGGPTAIHQAIYHDYTSIVDILLAQIDCSVDFVHLDTGLRHFHAACVTGNLNVARSLLSNGLVDLRLFFRYKLSTNRTITALHLAVEYSRLEIVELLLNNGAELNARCDEFGWTALHVACLPVGGQNQGDSESQLKIMEMLLERGCDVNARDYHGNTPLLTVFQDRYSSNSTAIGLDVDDLQLRKRKTEMLLKYHADVSICNGRGDTTLHLLIQTMEKLRRPKALANISFDDGIHVDIAKLLLTAGAPVNFRNQMRRSPLQLAVRFLSLDMVELLLKFDASFTGIEFDEDGFCYNEDVIPSLEATDNLLGIIERFASNGLILNKSSQLSVLKFLIRNHVNCRYDVYTDKNASYKLTNLLELGTDETIIAAFSIFPLDMYDTSFIGQSMKKKMVQQLYEHLTILVKGGFYVSHQLRENLYAKIVDLEKCILKVLGSTRKLSDVEFRVLENEFQAMKSTALNANTSLYDVLTINPSKIYYYIKNYAYVKTCLQSEESKVIYSRSRGILKGHFAKSLVRKYVTNSATQYLRYLIDFPLPDLCCEKIFDYLDNENILNLCVASVNIDFEKRKKFKSDPMLSF